MPQCKLFTNVNMRIKSICSISVLHDSPLQLLAYTVLCGIPHDFFLQLVLLVN